MTAIDFLLFNSEWVLGVICFLFGGIFILVAVYSAIKFKETGTKYYSNTTITSSQAGLVFLICYIVVKQALAGYPGGILAVSALLIVFGTIDINGLFTQYRNFKFLNSEEGIRDLIERMQEEVSREENNVDKNTR